jgi:hypothetical protein
MAKSIIIRIPDKLQPKVDYLKLLPGGISRFVKSKIEAVEIDKKLVDSLESATKKG